MTSISQLSATRPSVAARPTGPALQVDGAAFDNPRLDKGLVLSLACAEGNTNKDGSQRFLGRSEGCPTGYPAQGHVDPGDGLWNKGRLSFAPARHGLPESTSVAECERRALELVRTQMGELESKVQQLGMSPSNPNYRFVVATLMDSVNQTGNACFRGQHSLWNELPQALREMGQGKDPLQAMTDCRIRSHAKDDGSCGSFKGSWAETRSDQARRVGEIYDCLKLHGGVSPTAAATPPPGSTPVSKPGGSAAGVFDKTPAPSHPVLGGAPMTTGLLARGCEGAEVRGLQQKLNQAGAKLEVDGRYGPDTEQAVRDFQARHNLPPDGVTGPLTLRALDKAAGVLTPGAEGAQVRQLQEKLNQAGAQPRLDTDGVYGERTQQAVRDFQKQQGLSIDGIAGPETLRKLDEAPRAPRPSVPVTRPSQGSSSASGVSGLIRPIVQQDGTSCGLTSVAMIANAANAKAGTGARPIDDQDLRRENGGGTGFLPDVLNGHLRGTGFRATNEDWSGGSWDAIEKSLQSGNPVMVSTNGEFSASGYGHYIVLTKMEGNRVQYADPADGQMKWTTRETLDAQPAHTDGRWFSRLVKE